MNNPMIRNVALKKEKRILPLKFFAFLKRFVCKSFRPTYIKL